LVFNIIFFFNFHSFKKKGIVKKYVDYLPNLKVLRPDYKDRHADKYSVRVKEIYQKVHRDRPEVAMYGYEGSYPGYYFLIHLNFLKKEKKGPLIVATQDKKVEISWINRLPNRPLISINDTGAKELEQMLGLRNGNIFIFISLIFEFLQTEL
jgi:hypothetical protein